MNFISFSGILIFVSSLICSFIVLFSKPKTTLKTTWGLFSFAVGLWGLGLFKAFDSDSYDAALFWSRVLNLSAITIPIFFVHFTLLFTNRLKQKKLELSLYYIIVILFFLVSVAYPEFFVRSVSPKLNFLFYPDPGFLYYYFAFIFSYLAIYGVSILVLESKVATSIRRQQIRYVLIGVAVGFMGGSTTFFLVFGLNIYPFGTILVPLYVLSVSYSIIKYRLMDIKLVVTRVGIFLTIYSLILGIPFLIAYKILGPGLWLIPFSIMGFFATAGPFLYLFIQQRAEDRLLQEQKRYQTTLRQASAGMSRVKDLRKLLNLIVYIVTRAVRLEHALVYIYDPGKNEYQLGAFKRRKEQGTFLSTISPDNPLVIYLLKISAPILYDEIKQKVQDFSDQNLKVILQVVEQLEGSLVFPIQIEKNLIAIIVLGRKESSKPYTEEDLSVFSILANQTALAIENAQFYEDMKRTQEQLFQAEKMATIGTMADGLSHQINNRFHAMGFIAGDALDTLKICKDKPMSDDLKEVMRDLEKAFTRVQENVVQGGEVVQGLLRYTRKGDSGFIAVDFDQAFKSAFEMAQFKIKTDQLAVVKTYTPDIPKIKGNFTQLQEVFFNLIDNGYDAMMQRKVEKQESGYKPTLTIRITVKDNNMVIIFEDNGIGVKDEDFRKLFTPFFTTKLSSKKGTGLGLYVIKKIIEENHKGTVEMVSKYMVGTQMKLTLPIAV